MNMKEIANRINEYLKRFEHHEAINITHSGSNIRSYYRAYAWRAGRYIGIRYVSFQSTSYLSKSDAEKYLKWLDSGNVGKHWKVCG